MKEEIIKKIEGVLEELGVENPKVNFDVSARPELGDYSSSVAMAYAKELGKKPLDLANEIKEKLGNLIGVKNTEVAMPGFINFFFDTNYFAEAVKKPFSSGDLFAGQKYVIEHTQPNPFKVFHAGHLMNNAIGESIQRIIRSNGADVKTASYHGDKGLHIAKAIWSLQKNKDLNEAYAFGNKAFEESEESKKEITDINKKIYDLDPDINEIYMTGVNSSMMAIQKEYKKLGSEFDENFFESESGEIGKKIVLENLGKIFEEGENGAVIFRGENFEPKTHTRVFLNSEGIPTYEAKELGLAKIKKDKWSFDQSITITGNEQDSFFRVVEVAIGEVFPELRGRLKHLSHGMLKLPTGKMSSRDGNVISAESLIDQVKEKVKEKVASRDDGPEGPINIEEVSTIVAIGAIKYSILRQAIGGDIIFDFDKSISFEGDSGPYLQYSAVRANSLLKKSVGQVALSDKLPENWETTNLERYLERFPAVVEKAGQEYAPHHIATYLIELAGEFNSFYASHKIIDPEDPTSPYRLSLTKAFDEVMTRGLDLLGIRIPDKM